MVEKIKRKVAYLDIHTLEVFKKTSSATIVKVIGMIIGFFVSITLGRLLGADGFGILNLSFRITGLLVVVCLLGVQQVLVREIAIAKEEENTQRINNVLNTSFLLNGGLTTLVTVILIFLAPFISTHFFHNDDLTIPLVISVIVLVPQVFSRIVSSGLVGFKKIWQSNLVNRTLNVAIVGLLLLISFFLGKDITVNLVAVLYAVSYIIVTIAIGLYWNHLNEIRFENTKLVIGELTKSSLPLLLVSAALLISASLDSIMIGWLRDSAEVGIYSVALKLAMLTLFFQQVSTSAISPKIAVLYKQDRLMELEKMVKRMTAVLGLIGLLTIIGFYFVGKPVLSFWGKEFTSAYWVLIVLSIGQFFNIASGPIVMILIMTKREKIVRNITLLTLGLNVILNYFFIIKYGAIGAACATMLTIAANMLIGSLYVKKTLGFLPFAFFRILNK